MSSDPSETKHLLHRAAAGDQQALAELFAHYRELAKRFPEYTSQPSMPFFLWLRGLTGQKLTDLHRQHLGAKMRDAGQEVSLYRGALPQASSVSLANQLLGKFTTASRAVIRAETQLRV